MMASLLCFTIALVLLLAWPGYWLAALWFAIALGVTWYWRDRV